MSIDKKEKLKRAKYRLYALYMNTPHYEFTEQDIAIYNILNENLRNMLWRDK